MKFGDFLRKRREQHDWTQPEAAAKIGIEQSYLSKLETAKSYPSEDIYGRLVTIYHIDTAEMSKMLYSAELEKLREIKEVRAVVLQRQQTETTLIRGWLIAGLIFLMLGGAFLGATLNSEGIMMEYSYRSTGVILSEEPLTVFDPVEDTSSNKVDSIEDWERQLLIDRIEQHDQILTTYRGESFIEKVFKGKRFYKLYSEREIPKDSYSRWFIVPAFMFLIGSIGCFFISFKWK